MSISKDHALGAISDTFMNGGNPSLLDTLFVDNIAPEAPVPLMVDSEPCTKLVCEQTASTSIIDNLISHVTPSSSTSAEGLALLRGLNAIAATIAINEIPSPRAAAKVSSISAELTDLQRELSTNEDASEIAPVINAPAFAADDHFPPAADLLSPSPCLTNLVGSFPVVSEAVMLPTSSVTQASAGSLETTSNDAAPSTSTSAPALLLTKARKRSRSVAIAPNNAARKRPRTARVARREQDKSDDSSPAQGAITFEGKVFTTLAAKQEAEEPRGRRRKSRRYDQRGGAQHVGQGARPREA